MLGLAPLHPLSCSQNLKNWQLQDAEERSVLKEPCHLLWQHDLPANGTTIAFTDTSQIE